MEVKECHQCRRRFTRAFNLRRHIRTTCSVTHPFRPYECPLGCRKEFYRTDTKYDKRCHRRPGMFNSRYRRSGETIADYLAALRALASDCNYGQKLDEMLRDRLVCGMQDEQIQKSLLSQPEDKLDLKRTRQPPNYTVNPESYSEEEASIADDQEIKDKIAHAPTLKYFDVKKPITVTCDASKFGLGAACLQEGDPIAYASRTMTDTEQRYAQIEKELLAVVFACTKFHDYIYGKDIIVETDHQPLVTFVKKPLLSAPARLQRMLLRLQKYNITLVYKKGKELFIADTLSRAPLTTTDNDNLDLEVMTLLPVSDTRLAQLKAATARDATMQQLTDVISRGWPSHVNNAPPEARPYFPFREELTLECGNILKGQKAIIPKSLGTEYTKLLHEGHPGIEATKRRARDIVYWPSMCMDIEQSVLECTVCNATKAHQQKEPLKSYPPPNLPWEHIGVDLFQWNGMDYLALGDSYSGWFDFASLDDTCASTVIEVLKRQFSIHGIPASSSVTTHVNLIALPSNSLHSHGVSNIQQVVPTTLSPMDSQKAPSSVPNYSWKRQNAKDPTFTNLLNIRNVPTDPQLGSPSQRLMSRRLRTTVPTSTPLLKPSVNTRVTAQLRKRHQQQKPSYDKSAKPLRPLNPGQVVRLQTPKGHDQLGIVKKHSGDPRSYIVSAQGKLYRRNRRHLLPVSEPPPQQQHLPDFYVPPQEPLPQPVIAPSPAPQPAITRSGRISKRNPKYTDSFVNSSSDKQVPVKVQSFNTNSEQLQQEITRVTETAREPRLKYVREEQGGKQTREAEAVQMPTV
ncbi:uncharacterized protein LOC117305808 [Asterias rubens]|uniref:uncharacterized protein LOC117305808 n=1 Tax=Asterias rubens TaxID=7604 RepID=UPI001455AE47|nr:uncharacterized protein LOC117305808 [Asterias rubens]